MGAGTHGGCFQNSPQDGIVCWKPIVANLDEDDFKKWESEMGFRLSPSYKNFLAYKHFVELDFGHDAKFLRHTPDFMSDYRNHFAKQEWEEIMNEKLVPFADNNERGYFCFDLSDPSGDEFRVVTWEQEFGKQHYPSFVRRYTFIDLLQEMETCLDNRRKTERF